VWEFKPQTPHKEQKIKIGKKAVKKNFDFGYCQMEL